MGTERHLLCIEDPFELSHDLGRTVHAGECTWVADNTERWVCALFDFKWGHAVAAAGRQ